MPRAGRTLIAWSLLAAAAAGGVPRAAELRVDPAWSGDRIWDDGQAEVSHYEARRTIYGTAREYEAVLIIVKEDLDAATAVKADPPVEGRRLVTVLKLNILGRIATENYPYNFMTSVFSRRDDPRSLVKLAHSSQEWCGTTFKEVIGWDGPARLVWHSYFDGQADGQAPLELGQDSFLEEQLFIVLRAAFFQPGQEIPITVHDSLITNNARKLASRIATISMSPEEPITLPAGSFRAQRIVVSPGQAGGITLIFWREAGPRRAILRFESSDGRSLALKKIARRDYWSR